MFCPLLTILVFTTATGCGGSDEERTASAFASPSGSSPASTAATADSAPTATEAPTPELDATVEVAQPQIAQTAKDLFGAKAARTGTETAIAFTEASAYSQPILLATRPDGEDEVKALGDSMTENARPDWERAVNTFVNGNDAAKKKAASTVYTLTFYDGFDSEIPDGRRLELERGGMPAYVNPAITSIDTSASTDGRLQVKVDSTADYRLKLDGKPFGLTTTRTVTYYLVQADGQWKIDAWQGTWKNGDLPAA